jgi:SAM-dependent methyltransferase
MQGHATDDTRDWDEVYRREGDEVAIWSGEPNGSLVAEVADLPPGTALDVGCGEGGDAIWLARRGWRVTAIDPSGVALARAEAAARAADVAMTWIQAGLLELAVPRGGYDLVSAQYPVLRHTPDDAAMVALLGAVAPGGTLLLVHHELTADDHDHAPAGHDDRAGERPDGGEPPGPSFDPAEHVMPADVAARLDGRWEVLVDEVRARPGPLPEDVRHVRDLVLRARRHPADRRDERRESSPAGHRPDDVDRLFAPRDGLG